ncbi:MAG TPA: hypothetical protein PKH81_06435, partial [Treponemataceae bacterium]|nr:hypothetical protein [Treponemataceae bacterium]
MSCNCDGACDSVVRRSRRAVRLLVLRFVISSLLFAMAFLVPGDKGSYIFIISWFLSGYTVLFSAIRGLRNKKIFDENFLMSIATIGAFATGQWSEGAAVMLFFNLGEMIQESAVNRSRSSIEKCLDIRSNTARIHPDGSIVHPSQVAIGSLVMVLPGERVPLDGLLVEGSSSFDTSAITGESIPRDLAAGDEVRISFDRGKEDFHHPMLRLVWEDDYLIVVDKRNGLLSMSTDKIKEKTAYHLLSDYVKKSSPENKIFILHRLDRDTSGL